MLLANHGIDNQYFHSLRIKCPHRFQVFFAEFTFEETTYMKSHIKHNSNESSTEVVTAGKFADCNLRPAIGLIIREDRLAINCEQWDDKETIMPKEIELQTEVGGWNGQFITCPWPYILTRVIKYFKAFQSRTFRNFFQL